MLFRSEGLQASYDAQAGAYRRIFERLGLRFYEVDSDVGMMGGSAAMEYMAPSPAGEDRIALSEDGSYAANVELAPVGVPERAAEAPQMKAERVKRADILAAEGASLAG